MEWGPSRRIYYLPGHGGQLLSGLGQGLTERGFELVGRETRGSFRDLSFTQQVDLVRSDLMREFSSSDSSIVANSFGGYLFLHALTEMPAFAGRVLLLSPIVGDFFDGSGRGFSPPQPYKLRDLIESNLIPKLSDCEIHVGSEDWQSNPDAVERLGSSLGAKVVIAPGLGHMLGKQYVSQILDKWLP